MCVWLVVHNLFCNHRVTNSRQHKIKIMQNMQCLLYTVCSEEDVVQKTVFYSFSCVQCIFLYCTSTFCRIFDSVVQYSMQECDLLTKNWCFCVSYASITEAVFNFFCCLLLVLEYYCRCRGSIVAHNFSSCTQFLLFICAVLQFGVCRTCRCLKQFFCNNFLCLTYWSDLQSFGQKNFSHFVMVMLCVHEVICIQYDIAK